MSIHNTLPPQSILVFTGVTLRWCSSLVTKVSPNFVEFYPNEFYSSEVSSEPTLTNCKSKTKLNQRLFFRTCLQVTNMGELDHGFRRAWDVAVIGASCRFPGANSMEELWRVMMNKENHHGPPPRNRYYMGPGKIWARSYLDCPIDEFDAGFFNMNRRQAEFMDPQLRMFLELAWEALEDSRIPPTSLFGSKTGVFVGVSTNEYCELTRHCLNDGSRAYSFMGTEWSAYPGFLAFFLGLTGSTIAIESACASSGSAIFEAVCSLRRKESCLGIVAGTHLRLRHQLNVPNAVFGDSCRAFDADATGFTVAEGVGVVILKLLEHAQRDGDRILGVIKGVARNNSGWGPSFGTPNPEQQTEACRTALKDAGVHPSDITYVVAHGTGTHVGDPLEAAGILKVFEGSAPLSKPLIISSPKTNFGHCLATSGIHSLLHALLCLKYSKVPPQINFEKLNPKINFDSIPALIPAAEAIDWLPRYDGMLRIAQINNFGVTGCNVCLVVSNAPPPISAQLIREPLLREGLKLIPISAKSSFSLHALCRALREQLEKGVTDLGAFAWSLQTSRAHHPLRIAILARDTHEAAKKLSQHEFDFEGKVKIVRGSQDPVAFLFTGQGSEYFEIAKGLYTTSDPFKAVFDSCDAAFEEATGISLKQFIWEDEESFASAGARLLQPAFFSVQFALAQFWTSVVGVKPSVVLGHSLGELCAAVTSGVLSFQEGLQVACVRGSLVETLKAGGMMAISTSQEIINPLIESFNRLNSPHWVDLSAANTPDQCVVSGMKDSLAAFTAFVLSAYPQMKVKLLRTSYAFHSRQLDKLLCEFELSLKSVPFHPPTCIFVSSVTGEVVNEFSAIYWVRNLRQPVLFQKGLQTLFNLPRSPKIFIEIGPQPVLLNFVSSCGTNELILCPTLRAVDQACWPTILKSIGTLYTNWNGELNWAGLNEDRFKIIVDLPFYPFEHKVYNLAQPEGTSASECLRTTSVETFLEPLHSVRPLPGFHKETWILALPAMDLNRTSKSNAGGSHAPSVWLIFINEKTNSVGRALRELISEHYGCLSILIRPSLEFSINGEEVTLDPQDFSQFELLATQGWNVEGCICLWGTSDPSEISVKLSTPELIGGFLNVLKLMSSLLVPEKLVLVTEGALYMDGDPMVAMGLQRTTLHGLLKTFVTENPGIAVLGLDLDPNSQLTPSIIALQVFDQLRLAGIERELVIRQGRVSCARLLSFDPSLPLIQAAPGEPRLFYSENSYLVTGGLGGIGMQVAAWLLDRGAGKVILAGRRPPSDPTVIDKLEGFGAAASVALVDVSNAESVSGLFAQFGTVFPPLKGIFHAAGLLRDGIIADLGVEAFEEAFQSKVDGTLNLHRECLCLDLDHFVLFSSIASNVGLAGQAAYTAGNQFLDTFVKYRFHTCGLPALGINWSGWSDVGFVTNLLTPEQVRKMNERTGIGWFTAEDGIRALERALRLGLVQVTVADIDVSKVLESIHPRLGSYLSEVKSSDRWKDAANSIRKESRGNAIGQMVEELRKAEVGEKQPILEGIIEKCFRIYMALPADEVVDRGQNLSVYGMDSLLEIQITNRLSKELGIVISRNTIGHSRTITSMATTLLKALYINI